MQKPNRTLRRKANTAASTDDVASAAIAPVPTPTEPKGKIGMLVALLRGVEGTTIEAMMAATGWQAHSVRGALSGSVKKVLGYTVVSEKLDNTRIYRIVECGGAR
jgi:hypothetical protein